ncbi:MAG: sigma-54-dependent Fis family transcriptional regulator [Sphingobacteriia bacterium]|jgi:DNA-binding NtrC family response regulator|nr:sigma-54-dependent Fis family transcriptional regulator [Sphingobacteriia bacterium]
MSDILSVKQRFNIIGDHPLLNTAIDTALQVAPTDVTVLVNGENGTGKDIFSKILFHYGKRKHQPFIAINCGAIPEGTMDSELFGHEKGSFTSAHEARKGYFEEVNGGTIFMDEIAEMPLATQARLLRVLESGEYFRVGSSKVQRTDVRIITATNKNLLEAVSYGRFRQDLFYRLNTVTIHVPPLRERGKDILLLFRYFAAEFAHKYGRNPIRLTEDARPLLLNHRWPGNVRELRNITEQLTVLSPTENIDSEILQKTLPIEPLLPQILQPTPAGGNTFDTEREILYKILFDLRSDVSELKSKVMNILEMQGGNEPISTYSNLNVLNQNPYSPVNENFTRKEIPLLEESLSLEKKEKDLIQKALTKFRNNRKKAAVELGISERTLYRKIKTYGLDHL